jgi:hypothetical protein
MSRECDPQISSQSPVTRNGGGDVPSIVMKEGDHPPHSDEPKGNYLRCFSRQKNNPLVLPEISRRFLRGEARWPAATKAEANSCTDGDPKNA